MSPEHDNNPQPSAVETAPAQPESANLNPGTSAAITAQQGSGGIATAVARAQAAPDTTPVAAEANSSATGTIVAGAETTGAETHASPAETSGTPVATPEASPAVESAAPEEQADIETIETMDQLLDQFSTPPSATEGEIFD